MSFAYARKFQFSPLINFKKKIIYIEYIRFISDKFFFNNENYN